MCVCNHLLVWWLSPPGPLQTAWNELSLPMGLQRSTPKSPSRRILFPLFGSVCIFNLQLTGVFPGVSLGLHLLLCLGFLGRSWCRYKEHPLSSWLSGCVLGGFAPCWEPQWGFSDGRWVTAADRTVFICLSHWRSLFVCYSHQGPHSLPMIMKFSSKKAQLV